MQRAFGASHALGKTALAMRDDRTGCSGVMADFVGSEQAVVFAGFIPLDGVMRCTSTGETYDFSDFEDWQVFLDDRGQLRPVPRPSGSARGVMIA